MCLETNGRLLLISVHQASAIKGKKITLTLQSAILPCKPLSTVSLIWNSVKTINVYPDLGWNASSQSKLHSLTFWRKDGFCPLVPVQEMLFKNEAVPVKALLTDTELHIRYSSVLWHMLFLIPPDVARVEHLLVYSNMLFWIFMKKEFAAD